MKKIFKKVKTLYWRTKSYFVRYCYGNPSTKLKVVGVTGTSGKTTTATLLYKIATELGFKAGLISTVENIIVKEKRQTNLTTPDSVTLTKLFSEMVKKGCEYVFMEVSSHAVEQKRVAGITFAGGIFLNFSQDHLDYHKTMDEYFKAKKKFFRMLPRRAFALTNVDDERGVQMVKGIEAEPFSYGFNKDFDEVHFHGMVKRIGFDGLSLLFNKIPVKANLLGKFNAYNLLAVWSASSLLGFDMDKVNKILETIEPPKGRFEHFTSPNGVLVIVDYAHKPDALEKIYSALKDTRAGGRVITIVGCGGDRDPFKRPVMGKIAVTNSDLAIFTSDNPRSEDPEKILEQMKANLSPEELQKVRTLVNRREAIQEAAREAKRGDIVLCAGKGHENYQEIKGVKNHFDDMEELRKAYAKL